MQIDSIKLQSYRNYDSLSLSTGKGITVFYGENGAGKTNLLEAIHLCGLGRSHRSAQDRELVSHDNSRGRVVVSASLRDGRHDIEINLDKGEKRCKQIKVQGKPISRLGELMGHVRCVMFSPEDLLMIREGPSLRRRFMDMQLSQLRPAYFYALQKYNSALNQRNALLREGLVKKREVPDALLDVWDEQLAAEAETLSRYRRWFSDKIVKEAAQNYRYISGREGEAFVVRVKGVLAEKENPRDAMREGLLRLRPEDKRRAATHFGPHRDDIVMILADKDIKAFGSQGQIRTAALALKLSQLRFMEEDEGEKPVLLLDDVMSELDPRRRELLLERIQEVQAFVTCTDLMDLSGAKATQRIHVLRENGRAVVQSEMQG